MPGSIQIALIVLVTAAAWSDLRTRRIPNWITVPGAVLGFVIQSFNNGVDGALTSLAGACIGFGVFIALYMAGGMGAGDVKLFSAVGALVGPRALVFVFVFTGLLGGIAAIVLAVSRGRLLKTLEQTGALLLGVGVPSGPEALRLPYGAVIAGGALLSLVILH